MVERSYPLLDTLWLLVSIVLFAGSFTYSIRVQNPTLGRIIDLVQSEEHPDAAQADEVARLRTRIRRGGIYLRASATVILALMVLKPF